MRRTVSNSHTFVKQYLMNVCVSLLNILLRLHDLQHLTFFNFIFMFDFHSLFCNCVQVLDVGSAAVELLVHDGAGDREHHYDHNGHQGLSARR